MTSTLTRLGLGAGSLFCAVTLAACGSDSTSGIAPSAVSSPPSSSSSSSEPAASSSADSTSSSAAPSSSEASGGSSAGSVAAFCKTYNIKTITNAAKDPAAAIANFKAVARVAPPEIRSEAEKIVAEFDKAQNGQQPDTTVLRDSTKNITIYYYRNCR